ncbi:hypothetical protein [Candidatus Tisiphia endosymbiont of Thecophora atra]|uniref:hypothetical protein n=1 Tax=Candidatus Tisiphia endosymbiont of Thecophora atra TaxID=3066258 RepID=UPI00312C894E
MVQINIKIKNTVKFQENILIRLAETTDISSFVALSYKKRRAYEKAQPQFWKYAGSESEESQKQWFKELLRLDDHIMLAAVYKEKVLGFIIGRLTLAPKVYNPGGLTLMALVHPGYRLLSMIFVWKVNTIGILLVRN